MIILTDMTPRLALYHAQAPRFNVLPWTLGLAVSIHIIVLVYSQLTPSFGLKSKLPPKPLVLSVAVPMNAPVKTVPRPSPKKPLPIPSPIKKTVVAKKPKPLPIKEREEIIEEPTLSNKEEEQYVEQPLSQPSTLYDAYLAKINQRLQQYKQYPKQAKRRRQEGEIELEIRWLASGELIDVTISQSSGHKLLDKAAIKTVQRAAPFPKAPTQDKPIYIAKLPVNFSIN